MTIQEQIEELLEQIQNQTGILFSITDSQIDEEEMLVTLKNMLRAGHNSTSKEGFLRGLLLGLLSEQEIHEGIHRFHLEENGYLFPVLLETRQPISSMEQSVFAQFFSSGADTLIQTDDFHVALIRQLPMQPSSESLQQMLFDMQGTLEAEAMIPLRFAYDRVATSYQQLPCIFLQISTAMEIGNIFSDTEHIHWTQNLGLGKLIYHLPTEICEEYLQNHFQGLHLSDIDEETLHTIHTFLDSGLSIAECARKLYLHRNTLIYRLDKIEQLTGLDIRQFDDAIVCKIALMISTYLTYQENNI
ncbi:MAG: helix-turn-helix domain-containing protein [Lachnospiraceae bacterium]|nr:helix-turn-helix domain-containing protein [Lachnospiraceae bacterium]